MSKIKLKGKDIKLSDKSSVITSSMKAAYIKTKGNILRISFVTFISFVLLVCLMLLLARINLWIASFARSAILVFVSILYFKMYDFFYLFPVFFNFFLLFSVI